MEYTKGEWKVEWNEYTGRWEIVCLQNGKNLGIANMFSGKGYKADAQLMAAAPAMYKALEAIVEEGTRCIDAARPGREIYDIDNVDRMARQAIAKAESN